MLNKISSLIKSYSVSVTPAASSLSSGSPLRQPSAESSISPASSTAPVSFWGSVKGWFKRIFSCFFSFFGLSRTSVPSTKTDSLETPEAVKGIIKEHLIRAGSTYPSPLDPSIHKDQWVVILELRKEEKTLVSVKTWTDPNLQQTHGSQVETFLRDNPGRAPLHIFTVTFQNRDDSKINFCNSFTSLKADGSTLVVTNIKGEKGLDIEEFTQMVNSLFQNPSDRTTIYSFIKPPSSEKPVLNLRI
jgi:hypothetical protein